MTSNDGYIPTGVVSGHAALVSAIRNDPEAFFERVFWELNPNTS